MGGCVQEEVELRILFNVFMETRQGQAVCRAKTVGKRQQRRRRRQRERQKKSNRFNKDCYSVNILLYSSFCHCMFGCIPMYSDVFNHLSGPLLISALLKGQILYKYR